MEVDDLLRITHKASGRAGCHGNHFQASVRQDGLEDSRSGVGWSVRTLRVSDQRSKEAINS